MKKNPKITVGVEVEGGRIVPVMDAEAQSRAHAVFTTSADHQRRADIRIYYREGEVGDWQAVETVVVNNIADCRAGEPDIDFCAEKAADGTLIVRTQALAKPRHARGKLTLYLLVSLAGALALTTAALVRPAAPKSSEVRAAVASSSRQRPRAFDPVRPDVQPGLVQPVDPPSQRSSLPAVQREPVPAPQPAPRVPAEEEYQVQWGDTLWRITEKYYGDRSLYPQLADRNGLADPDLIISGQSLILPPVLGSRSLGE